MSEREETPSLTVEYDVTSVRTGDEFTEVISVRAYERAYKNILGPQLAHDHKVSLSRKWTPLLKNLDNGVP